MALLLVQLRLDAPAGFRPTKAGDAAASAAAAARKGCAINRGRSGQPLKERPVPKAKTQNPLAAAVRGRDGVAGA
jgi:hypothetical protein